MLETLHQGIGPNEKIKGNCSLYLLHTWMQWKKINTKPPYELSFGWAVDKHWSAVLSAALWQRFGRSGLSLLDRCRCIMNSEMSHPPLCDWDFMYIHESTEEYGGKHHPEQATACPGARPLPSCLHLSVFAPIALGHAVLLCGSVCGGIIICWHIHSIFSMITLCASSYRMLWINSKKENYIILVRSFHSIEWRSLHVVVSTWYSSKHAYTYHYLGFSCDWIFWILNDKEFTATKWGCARHCCSCVANSK